MRHLLLAAATAFFSATAALAGGPQGFTVHDSPQEVPNFRFVTEDGTRHYLEEFRDALSREFGFEPDLEHFTVSGTCLECRTKGQRQEA